jgi:hypothetical protein
LPSILLKETVSPGMKIGKERSSANISGDLLTVTFNQIKTAGSFVKILFFLCLLKRQSHEIFDLHFFHKSMAPKALINALKYF